MKTIERQGTLEKKLRGINGTIKSMAKLDAEVMKMRIEIKDASVCLIEFKEVRGITPFL